MGTAELKLLGEDAAEQALSRKGMRIVARNWRCRMGELDLVALDGDTLVFVEVKCRATDSLYDPALAVDYRKRMKVRKLAQVFLATVRPGFANCRFDVVSVTAGPPLQVLHIADAFE